MKTNKGIAVGIFLLIAIFMTSIAVNADLTVIDTFDENNPTFGDDNQEASNPEHDTDSRKEQFAEGTITLNNSDSVSVNTFTIDSFTANGFNLDKDDFEITAKSPINAGESGTITIKAKIPEDLNAV
ncbi:MAG: hypothetical protein Q8Q42_00345, partial [Nanoarchaeota archaeon]|nr:hypothetical protein [Nanoarchaeota archaeon]